MEKPTEEQLKEFQENNNKNLLLLTMFVRSVEWDIDEIMYVFSMFIALLIKVEKIDEEDLRDMFRIINHIKDKINFV